MKDCSRKIQMSWVITVLVLHTIFVTHKLYKIEKRMKQIENDIYCIERYLKEAI